MMDFRVLGEGVDENGHSRAFQAIVRASSSETAIEQFVEVNQAHGRHIAMVRAELISQHMAPAISII